MEASNRRGCLLPELVQRAALPLNIALGENRDGSHLVEDGALSVTREQMPPHLNGSSNWIVVYKTILNRCYGRFLPQVDALSGIPGNAQIFCGKATTNCLKGIRSLRAD
jgi:hypothetical protein